MSAQITSDELQKVLANLGKLHAFFESHANWAIDDEGGGALAAIRGHLDGLDASLTRLMENNGVAAPTEPTGTVELLPDGHLDAYKMTRFGAYLEQLELWLLERMESLLSPDLVSTTAEAWGSLRATAAAAARIATRNDLDAAPPPRAAALVTPSPTRASTEPIPGPARTGPRGPTPKLVLDPENDPPLLDERADTFELSSTANQMIDEFLNDASIEMNSHDRHQLERKVERWLMTTPDGQQLVLKITDLHGSAAPYPTYRQRPRQEDDEDDSY